MALKEDVARHHATYLETRFFGALDGVRFLCIAVVMWHHSPLYAAMPEPAKIFTRGFIGVDFFFVISGFLITTLLLREESRDGAFSLRQFYRRRILRIVPVYFLVITLISFWWIVVRGQTDLLAYVPYYYLFLSNFLVGDIPLLTITWSLSVEEQYYLIWPVLLFLLPMLGRWRMGVVTGLIALFVLMSAGILANTPLVPPTEITRFVLPVASYGAILIGTLLGLALHSPKGFALLWRLVGHAWAPVGLFGAVVAALVLLPEVLTGWPNLILHSLMALALASVVIREDQVLAKGLGWPPFARIGQISYGLYLYHLIGRHIGVELAAALGAGPWIAMGGFVLASVLMAELSFRTYEAYFLRLKDRSKT